MSMDMGLLAGDPLSLLRQREVAVAAGYRVAFSRVVDMDWEPTEQCRAVPCWLHGVDSDEAVRLAALVSDGELPSRGDYAFDSWVMRLKGLNQPSGSKLRRLIIIAASTGGPSLIANMLANLPLLPDISLIVVQHQSAAAEENMIEQFGRRSDWPTVEVNRAMRLSAGHCYVTSAKLKVDFNSSLSFVPAPTQWTGDFSPSIDHVVGSVATKFRGECLVVYLTGMTGEGPSGARLARRAGATIWTQIDAVADGMINDIKNVIEIDREVHADMLADELINWANGRRPTCHL